MRNTLAWSLAAAVMVAGAAATQAANVAPAGSGMQAYFGSQSNAYTASDPTAGPWGAPGFGTYAAGATLPGVPAPPVPLVYPTFFGNAFQGSGYTTLFNDGNPPATMTKASATINDSFLPVASTVSDMQITIPNWSLVQGPSAPGYAYNQMNFASDYLLTNNSGGLTASAPSFPVFINGTVVGGSSAYAQFDATMEYWFASINTAGVIGTPVLLGTLSYTFTQSGGGTFNTTVFSSGTIGPTPLSDGIMEIVGHAWLAGDPSTINVSTVPEPASLAVLAMGGLALLRRRR